MPTTKEQMNVQIAASAKRLAKVCATAHRKSLAAWVELAIEHQAARDRAAFKLDAMEGALRRVANKYLPGQAASPAQMLAMAQRVAREDTQEGLAVKTARKTPTRRTATSAGSRTRKA